MTLVRPHPLTGIVVAASVAIGLLSACTTSMTARTTLSPTPDVSVSGPTGDGSAPPPPRPACPPARESNVTGHVADPALDEISGIVAGRRLPGVLWAEEDSGNEASIYALRPSGEVVARVAVAGATNVDWEDLAWGMGRLWVADIGDNAGERTEIQVYSFPEPDDRDVSRVAASVLRLRYEDGPHDAEAMFVDPREERLYVVVKQLGVGDSGVYAIALEDVPPDGVGVLRQVATVPLPIVTAADNGPAGIAVRNYLTTLVFPWADDRSVVTTLTGTPCSFSLGSSEAVAQMPDGSGLFSISEGVRPPIRYVGE